MIDKLKYEQVLAISNDLREQAKIVSSLATKKDLQELVDFASTVEGYSKFLESTVEMNKDADNALSELKAHMK